MAYTVWVLAAQLVKMLCPHSVRSNTADDLPVIWHSDSASAEWSIDDNREFVGDFRIGMAHATPLICAKTGGAEG